MAQVNIHEAKTHLSRLLDAVCHGEEIILAKSGKPIAKLIPFTPPNPVRKPGRLKEHIEIAADFDAPLPHDYLDQFEGK